MNCLGIILLDTLIFYTFIFWGKPHSSVAIGLVVLVPFLFLLNFIIGLVLYLRKLRRVAGLMLLNSLLAPLIFYLVWIHWSHYDATTNYMTYLFSRGFRNYEILISKESRDFSITDRGNDAQLYYGEFKMYSDTIKLETSENRMYIIEGFLHNFPLDSNAIELKLRE